MHAHGRHSCDAATTDVQLLGSIGQLAADTSTADTVHTVSHHCVSILFLFSSCKSKVGGSPMSHRSGPCAAPMSRRAFSGGPLASRPGLHSTRRVAQPCRALERYLVDKLSAAESTFKEMQLRMADPDVAANAAEFQRVAKAAADLELTSITYQKHKEAEQQLADSQAYLKEVSSDPEMAELVREEIAELQTQLVQLETKLKMLLLPKDPLDEKNIMLEIRAGAGGDEAGIWAGDLYRMYTRCAMRGDHAC